MWDPYSDQPYRIKGEDKVRFTRASLLEYAKTAATAIGLAPAVAVQYVLSNNKPTAEPDQFTGLSISADSRFADATVDLVAELGVRELLIRVPAWEADRADEYAAFMQRFGRERFLVNILQDREHVLDLDLWQRKVRTIVEACHPWAPTFQIGNAINRTKWGCRHSGEYLQLETALNEIRSDFPNIRFLGSSVIDFEPLVTLRTLFNGHDFTFDACASELYVNRRGAPGNRQFGLFGLAEKIRLIAAMSALSNRIDHDERSPRIWITETNWPLLNTKPWTPNSGDPRSTVDEATQAQYLTDYYRTAWQSGLVERVYWWQLINPGYGLVDHRQGGLRKLPSFEAFRQIANGAFYRRNSD